MYLKPDKVSNSSKRKRDVASESTEPKFSRLEADDVIDKDPRVDDLQPIPIDIVPNHSDNPGLNELLEEYYPTKTYAQTQLKRERYAKATNGDEIYHPDEARYATYIVNVDGIEHKVEYVPLKHDRTPIFLLDEKDNFIYPFDLTSEQPLFQTDSDGNETYFRKGSNEICPKSKQGIPLYAKLHTNDEYVPTNQGIPYYAIDNEGNEHYPRNAEQHQYYIWIKNEQVPAKKVGDIPFYAQTKDGDEYYPRRIVGA